MPQLSPLNRLTGRRDSAAFTLIEILVSVTIVVFLVLLLGQIISSAQAIWRHAETRTDAFREARAALDLMSRDLALALTDDRAPVLTLSNIYDDQNDPTVGPQHNQQVYALIPMRNVGDPPPATPPPTRTDLCATGFYCVWDNNRRAYVLRRHMLQSNPTFTRLQSAFAAAGPVDPLKVYNPLNPAANPSEDEDIASYVWDLKVLPYENNAGAPPTPNASYPVIYRATLPEFIEVSFKAFSPQAARQLEAQNIGPEIWFDPTSAIYRNQISPHVQTFVTRIRLQNARMP